MTRFHRFWMGLASLALFLSGCAKLLSPQGSASRVSEPPGQVYLTRYQTMQLLGDFNGWAIEDLEHTRMTLVADWTWTKTVHLGSGSIMFKFVPNQTWDLAYGTPDDDNGALEGYALPNQSGTGNHIDAFIPEAGYWTFEFHEDNGHYRIYPAEGPPGGIAGRVVFTDDSLPPYPQAIVYAYTATGTEAGTAHTDTLTGDYEIQGLEPGTYQVVATAPGYQPDTLSGIQVEDQVVSVDPLVLEPLEGPIVNITIDGIISPEEGWVPLDTSQTTGPEGANLFRLYAAADAQYLYLALETRNTANWGVAYGFGLDLQPGGFTSQAGQDAWERLINFGGSLAVDAELYLHWNDGDQSMDAVNLCIYDDTGGTWTYDAEWAEGQDFAYTGDATQGLQVLEFRIPWDRLGGLPSQPPKGLVWVAGNDPGSSAVDVIPDDPAVHDAPPDQEWTDLDTFETAVSLPTP